MPRFAPTWSSPRSASTTVPVSHATTPSVSPPVSTSLSASSSSLQFYFRRPPSTPQHRQQQHHHPQQQQPHPQQQQPHPQQQQHHPQQQKHHPQQHSPSLPPPHPQQSQQQQQQQQQQPPPQQQQHQQQQQIEKRPVYPLHSPPRSASVPITAAHCKLASSARPPPSASPPPVSALRKHQSAPSSRRFAPFQRCPLAALAMNRARRSLSDRPKADARPDRASRNNAGLASFASLGRLPAVFTENEALVTLFKRDTQSDGAAPAQPSSQPQMGADGNVLMSQAGQKVIPATFNLVPIEQAQADAGANPFDQAGGHEGSFHTDGAALVKKVTDREAAFYEAAQAGCWPKHLLPEYYGREAPDAIKIENLTHGFKRPCVIDLKMGVQTVENDEASILKRIKMTALDHFTRSKSEGCRLEGLSMYRTLENRRVKGTKTQSHSISAHVRVSIQDVLTFFLTDETGVRTDVALRFQSAVERILEAFEMNDRYRFIGSSILLIYDNDNRAPYMHWARALRKLHTIAPHVHLSEDQVSGLTRRTRVDVRMIDFAHTSPMPEGMKRDLGYMTGLRTILKALKAIRVFRSKPIFSLHNAVVDLMEKSRAETKSQDGDSGGAFTFETVLSELTALSDSESERTVPSDGPAEGSEAA